MWEALMDPTKLNVWLNLVGIILGGGALGVVLTHLRGMRGLDQKEAADIRDHYQAELASLRAHIATLDKRYLEYQGEADRRYREAVEYHDQCVAERNELRVSIDGLKAQLLAQSADRVLLLEKNCIPPSEAVVDAAKRVKKIQEEGPGK